MVAYAPEHDSGSKQLLNGYVSPANVTPLEDLNNALDNNYLVPDTTVMGGEFEIHTPNTSLVRANEVSTLFSQYSNPVQGYGPGTSIDLTPFLALSANPAALVSALDLTLTHGVMPASMKAAIVNAVTSDAGGSLHRVQTACYLILTSGYFG
jgi:hypothetical protein